MVLEWIDTMMGEDSYHTTPKKRNNNLAGYAILCLLIGGPLLQVSVIFLPFMVIFPVAFAGGIITLFALGIVFAVGGVYFLVQWWNSGV
jgi:hypothetical protein